MTLTRCVKRLVAALAALTACAAMAGNAPLQDPTRPPAALAPAATGAAGTPGAPAAAPQLQSILIGRAPGGRRVAVIDGETVQLGGTFHGARLARMTDTEVTLVRGHERQVLRLFAPESAAVPAAVPAAPATATAAQP